LLRDLHTGAGARVRVSMATSERFATSSGVRQGCVLAPALFNRAIDWVLEHACGISINGLAVGRCIFTDLDYADDIAMPAADRNELISSLHHFSAVAGKMGLQVSWAKMNMQSMAPHTPTADAVINGYNVESVRFFCYLGGTIHSTDGWGPDVRRRIGIAAAAVDSLARNWSQDQLALATTSQLRQERHCLIYTPFWLRVGSPYLDKWPG